MIAEGMKSDCKQCDGFVRMSCIRQHVAGLTTRTRCQGVLVRKENEI